MKVYCIEIKASSESLLPRSIPRRDSRSRLVVESPQLEGIGSMNSVVVALFAPSPLRRRQLDGPPPWAATLRVPLASRWQRVPEYPTGFTR